MEVEKMNNIKGPENLKLENIDLETVSGGIIVDDGNGQNYWLVRQDGTVISPVPGKEKAIEFAKAFNISKRTKKKTRIDSNLINSSQ